MSGLFDVITEPNDVIRGAREHRGISAVDVAASAGLTIHEYEDLEDYPDEAIDVVCIAQLKRICSKLSIDIRDLYGLEATSKVLPIDIVKKRMKERGVSVEVLARAVGIDEEEIHRVCVDVRKIGAWVYVAVVSLGEELQLDVADLLYAATSE